MVIEIQSPAARLEAASQSLRDANRKYEASLAHFKKWTTTGSAAMDEGIRKATEEHLTPDLRAAEAAAIEAADAATEAARTILYRKQSPRITIDAADELRAGASYERIRDRVKTLPLEKLVASVRSAVEADDRAEMLNFYETLSTRLDADASGLSPKEKEARLELRSLRSEIFERMKDRSLEAYEDDALEIIMSASDLRKRAGKFQRENAPKRPYSFQGPNDVRWDVAD